MDKSLNTATPYYRAMVTIVGIASLFIGTFLLLPKQINSVAISLIFVFIVLLVNFPLRLLLNEITMLQVVSLGGGLLYGAIPVAWAVLAGIFLGKLIYEIRSPRRDKKFLLPPSWWLDTSYAIGYNVLPLIIVNPGLGWVEKFNLNPSLTLHFWSNAYITVFAFSLLHGLLFLFNYYLQFDRSSKTPRRDLVSLFLIEILPIPFILLMVEAYPSIGDKSLIAIGGIPIIIAIMLSRMLAARFVQERRVQELSTLDRVSETLRTTLDLEDLLPVIQEQVTRLLGIDNFYVALLDDAARELWYPLAIKNGEPQSWSRRPVMDRLTDRVIQNCQPILLTPRIQAGPNPIGLPTSEDTPTSWLGVPLVVSEKAIGCLAVFELSSNVEFSSDDVDLLTILSGQVSVAIDNALLYDQAQSRATQLETLNSLTKTITGSLNLEEVLEHVCNSVSFVAGNQSSAIFLTNPGEETVRLAHTHKTSEGFSKRNSKYSIGRSKRTRCLRSGQPVIIPDVQSSSLSLELIQLFKADNIRAVADLPFIIPEGKIGFLSVFFDSPHAFQEEEVELLQTFASQAALAVSNARLHAVTDEQLSRRVHQLAILEAVGRELSAASHSDQLTKLILDYALEFTNSLCGGVGIYYPEVGELQMKATRGYESDQRVFHVSQGITGRSVRLKEVMNVGNVREDPDFENLRHHDTRSQLSVPIIHENRVLGVITLESTEPDAFEESEQSLVVQLANQAAISLVNADLYHRSQRSLRELSTLYQVSTRLVGVLGVREVFDILEIALNALFVADVVGVYIWQEENDQFILRQDLKEKFDSNTHLPKNLSGSRILALGLAESSMNHIQISSDNKEFEIFFTEKTRDHITLFPLVNEKQVVGIIILQDVGVQTIQQHDLELVGAIIAQCVLSLQNARLFSDAMNVRNRLSAVINSVGEGIIMVNTQGQILLVNEPIRAFSGIPLEQLERTCLAELPDGALKIIGYTRERLIHVQEELSSGQIPASQKIEFSVPDRSPVLVLSRETSPVLGLDGKVIGWMIVLHDQTEEYEIQKAREVITETLVHDLRSPMSAVVGALDFMDVTLPEKDRGAVIEQSMRVAQSGSRRVLGLIDALLDISHLQSGQMGLEFVPMDIFSIVDVLMPDFTLMANEYGIIIRNDIPKGLPVITADQDKIVRVLSNLLDNAVKFTPAGGQVIISASLVSEDIVAVHVEDSGPGIPEEYREKIFERFWQVPGQRTRRRGSGLGLAFCKLAIEAHGGKIWVDSPQGKSGSIFTFTLPIRNLPTDA